MNEPLDLLVAPRAFFADPSLRATVTRDLSDRLCRSPLGRDTCGALHGVWEDLRNLGLAASPTRHSPFFESALAAGLARRDGGSVLVSGTADHAMLEMVHGAAIDRGCAVEATVIDLCVVPLLLSTWYAAAHDLPVRTLAAPVMEAEVEGFEVVVTHSLLRYFAPEQQPALVRAWRRLLRPGGRVVTVTRLDDGASPSGPSTAESVAAFAAIVRQAATDRGPELVTLSPGELEARAARFAAASAPNPVGGSDDVRRLFEGNGFRLDSFEVRELPSAVGAVTVSGASQAAAYAEIVAVAT